MGQAFSRQPTSLEQFLHRLEGIDRSTAWAQVCLKRLRTAQVFIWILSLLCSCLTVLSAQQQRCFTTWLQPLLHLVLLLYLIAWASARCKRRLEALGQCKAKLIQELKDSALVASTMARLRRYLPELQEGLGAAPAVPPPLDLHQCDICLEQHQRRLMVATSPQAPAGPSTSSAPPPCCPHMYCLDCMATYCRSQVELRRYPVRCPAPGCNVEVAHATVERLLAGSKQQLEALGQAMVESMIDPSQRLYCPHKDCSACLLKPEKCQADEPASCPECHRHCCPTCLITGWHEGFSCEQFQQLPEHQRSTEDAAALRLAGQQQWKQCPACKYMVERSAGCNHMRCHCGASFCYICGRRYASQRPTPNNVHGSPSCACNLFDVPPEPRRGGGARVAPRAYAHRR